ncbi:UDP-N-acetylmuramoyl-L-alanyl-D-glutamate--2,6-diaminopimelate ligase [Virgibacillus kimchii]
MNTQDLLSSLRIRRTYGKLPEKINDIQQDSRKVGFGTLFVCIHGYTVDGHNYCSEAVSKGATVIIAERKIPIDFKKASLIIVPDSKKALSILANKFYRYPSTKMNIFGVTGTNGKTTVTSLIKATLEKLGNPAALSGTNGLEIGNECFPSKNTTSDALTNQQLLHQVVKSNIEDVVMEVSSQGLSEGRLWGIDFDIVTFTNLTHDHLDYHETMEQYGYVKSLLFSQLGNAMKKPKFAVLNQDDPWSDFYRNVTSAEVITYAVYAEANFHASNIRYYKDRTYFSLHSPEGVFQAEMRLLGEFNVYNALATIASLYAKGVSVSKLVNILKEIGPIQGRMEKITIQAPVTMYVDYAHTPDAIEKSISTVLPFKQNRLIYVVGTGGNRDAYKRPFIAEKASSADIVILTINDPRNEDTEVILREMEQGMLHHNYALIPDRKEAISHAIEISEPGDIIVFAGKGREDYQIIQDKKQPHSDLAIAMEQCQQKYQDSTPSF